MWAFTVGLASLILASLCPVSVTSAAPVEPPAAVQYFQLDPGTPTADGGVFRVPVFVLGEPAGSAANLSEVRQAWEDLSILYLNETPAPFASWSVPSWGPGRFDLRLVLTDSQVSEIEEGQAILTLNSSILVGPALYGAAGEIGAAVLSSSIDPSAWWNSWFDIQSPPPSSSPTSLDDVVSDLAWFGDSTAGRALYASVALGSAVLYLLEAHRVARSTLSGKPAAKRGVP